MIYLSIVKHLFTFVKRSIIRNTFNNKKLKTYRPLFIDQHVTPTLYMAM